MTGIFDSAIFDSKIFDCGTVEEQIVAGGSGRPVQRGYRTKATTPISGLLKFRVEGAALISGQLGNPVLFETTLSGSLINKFRIDKNLSGKLQKILRTENDISSTILYRISKSEQLTGTLSRLNKKTLIAASLALDDDELLFFSLT